MSAAANGLDVIAHEDWTSRLRGFWDLSIAEVMLRRGAQEERTSRARGFFGNALVCLKKVRAAGGRVWTALIRTRVCLC
jgi:hypothetical protein